MANGKQLSDANFARFTTWLASKSHEDLRQMVNRRDGVLSRKEISAECGFDTSALRQNPRIKTALMAVEEELREHGILPPMVKPDADSATPSSPSTLTSISPKSFDTERLRRLELENASLKTENQELKRQLEKFAVLREVLSTTGRLPR